MNRLKRDILLFLFSLFSLSVHGASLSYTDSLLLKIKTEKVDSLKLKDLLDLGTYYNNTGYANDQALLASEEALQLAGKNNYTVGRALAYFNMGSYFSLKGDKQKTLDFYLKALDIFEKKSRKLLMANVYNNISAFYLTSMKNYTKAMEYAQKGLEIKKQLGDKAQVAFSFINIGGIYYDLNDYKNALSYFLQSLDIFNELGDKYISTKATIENNLGSVYTALNQYDSAIGYYQKSLAIYGQLNDTGDMGMSFGNIGNVYNMKGDMQQGIKYSERSLIMARQVNDKNLVASAYEFLSEGYGKMGNYQKAYEYRSALSNLKDTIYDEANAKQVNDMQVKYDSEKKDRENKILELSVNRQKIINYSISAGLILLIALVFFVFRGYINKKRAHEELAEKNKIIEEKNKDIVDSINYAQTIQHAILTPEDYLKETLGEYFIVYKPRDVVSGDFYWCHTNGNKIIFAVADCTGHGVPGAFMSMIGNSLLNEVIIENNVMDAAGILNTLRTGLLKTLQQKGQNSITRDGMDIALCVWDKNKNTIQYAGANNPLYLVRDNVEASLHAKGQVKIYNGRLAEFLPDKQPIGYYETKTDVPFSSHTIQLQKGDIIYVSTDGYADQFGGEAVKKYTKKKFREMLMEVSLKRLDEQKITIESAFETWKGNNLQTDDICLMGIKIA